MNRRTLLTRFAAIAAAVAVAPRVETVQATMVKRECCNGVCGGQGVGEPEKIDALYVKAYGQEKWDEWTEAFAPLTFEALAADCSERGHWLVQGHPIVRDHGELRCVVHAVAGHHQLMRIFAWDNLTDLDAWRRSLHEQATV